MLPIDGSGTAPVLVEKPEAAVSRARYVVQPDTRPVPFNAAPRVLDRSHSITARVDLSERGAEGVLLPQGTAPGGYSPLVQEQRLNYVHNYAGRNLHRVSTVDSLTPGAHELRLEFEPTGAPDMAQGKGTPARSSSTSKGRSKPSRGPR